MLLSKVIFVVVNVVWEVKKKKKKGGYPKDLHWRKHDKCFDKVD